MVFPHDKIISGHEFSNPSQTGFDRRMIIVDFMPIETETGFQSQGIAGTKSDRLYPEFRSGFETGIPQFLCIFIISINFTTTRTGITCRGENNFIDPRKRYFFKSIILHIDNIFRGQLLHGFQCQRPLDSQLANIVGSIFQFDARFHTQFCAVFYHPVPVFFDISSINYQQVFFSTETIHQQVVYNTTLIIGETTILYFSVYQSGHIICG